LLGRHEFHSRPPVDTAYVQVALRVGGKFLFQLLNATLLIANIPRNNVLLLGAITLAGTFLLTFEKGAELLNFGAFIAFIGVNAAALIHYKFRSQEKVAFAALSPLCGLVVCTFIWLNLNLDAKLLVAAWVGVGLILYFVMKGNKPLAAVEWSDPD